MDIALEVITLCLAHILDSIILQPKADTVMSQLAIAKGQWWS